jgi:hypothetical protein
MIRYNTVIKKFTDQGEKTGWTYIEVPAAMATQLMPGNKKGFRVKGRLDKHAIEGIALLPMGEGNFILTLNATLRKALRKEKGDSLDVQLAVDKKEPEPPEELLECLRDEPSALEFFQSLTKGHQNYFGNYINTAKTDETRAKRIVHTLRAMTLKQDFGTMVRSIKAQREKGLE